MCFTNKKNLLKVVLMVWLAVFVTQCSDGNSNNTSSDAGSSDAGDTTEPVEETPSIAAAVNTIVGTFSEPGADVASVSVALYRLQTTGGREDEPLAQTYTDTDGNYTLELIDSIDLTSGHYVVVGFGSELARNLTANTNQHINPITEAVSNYIDELLALGANLNDFSTETIASLLSNSAACNSSDTETNIRTCFLGMPTFTSVLAGAVTDTPIIQTLIADDFAVLGAASFDQDLSCNDPDPASGAATGFTFDMTGYGEVSDGFNSDYSDACDDCGSLDITSGDFFAGSSTFPERADGNINQARLEDVDADGIGDQVVYLATTDAGISVTRKVYVPKTFDCTLGGTIDFVACGYARHLDCFNNNSGADVTLNIQVSSNLGSDGSELAVGSSLTEGEDELYYWATKEDSSDPQVGYVVDGRNASISADSIVYGSEGVNHAWYDQTIANNATACYMYYFALGDRNNPDGDILGLLDYLLENSPRDGISATEDQNIRNWEPQLYSIKGGLGSMPPNSTITITNTTTSESQTVTADQYGQFNGFVGCEAGETITAVSSVGSMTISGTCQ